jgi:hypothetical protein
LESFKSRLGDLCCGTDVGEIVEGFAVPLVLETENAAELQDLHDSICQFPELESLVVVAVFYDALTDPNHSEHVAHQPLFDRESADCRTLT